LYYDLATPLNIGLFPKAVDLSSIENVWRATVEYPFSTVTGLKVYVLHGSIYM